MSETIIFGLVTAIFVGVSAGYLGSLMVLEKMALVGDALSHVALPGLAIGYYFALDYPLIGAFVFLFASVVIIWQLQRVTKISFEALVGAMFTLALAIGILITPETELLEALFGNISSVNLVGTVAAVVISLAAVFLTRIIYKKLVLAMISEDIAVSKGINVAMTNLLYLFLVSLVVAIGIQIAGTLLVGVLVIVPAIAAKNLSSNMRKYSLFSAVFGAVASFTGVLVASIFNISLAGPMVVFAGIAIFAVSVVINWRMKLTT